jgi:hypothetical protein
MLLLKVTAIIFCLKIVRQFLAWKHAMHFCLASIKHGFEKLNVEIFMKINELFLLSFFLFLNLNTVPNKVKLYANDLK